MTDKGMDSRVFKKPYKRKRRISRKDFRQHRFLGAVALPLNLGFPTRILNQGSVPACTAVEAVAGREAMTGNKYDWKKQWQAEKDFIGDQSPQGVELEDALAVRCKVGYFKEGESTPSDKTSAYFFINKRTGDWFDTVRNRMCQLYEKYGKVVPLAIGVNWYHSWDYPQYGIVPDNATGLLGGHDIKIVGFQNFNLDHTDYIVLQNSWGENFGDNGLYRVSREVFNKWFDSYGVGYVVDDPDLQFQRYGLLQALIRNLLTLIKRLTLGIAEGLGFSE